MGLTLGTGASKLLQLDRYVSLNVHVVLAPGGTSCAMKWLGEGDKGSSVEEEVGAGEEVTIRWTELPLVGGKAMHQKL